MLHSAPWVGEKERSVKCFQIPSFRNNADFPEYLYWLQNISFKIVIVEFYQNLHTFNLCGNCVLNGRFTFRAVFLSFSIFLSQGQRNR